MASRQRIRRLAIGEVEVSAGYHSEEDYFPMNEPIAMEMHRYGRDSE